MPDTTTHSYIEAELAIMAREAVGQIRAILKEPIGNVARWEKMHRLFRHARPMQREVLAEAVMMELCGITLAEPTAEEARAA